LTFVILGAVGFVWLFFWLLYYRQPEQCRWISEQERQLILSTRDTGSAAAAAARNLGRRVEFKSAFGVLLRQRSMWGVMLTQGCSTYFNYVFLTWLPTYLVQARGLHLVQAGFIGAIPYLVAVIAVLGFSRLSDWLLTPEGLNQGRRRNIVVALLLGCCVAVAANFVASQFALVVVLSLAMSFNLAGLTLNLILANDLLEDGYMIATVQSMISVSSNVFGIFAPVVTGYTVKATGSFAAAFYIQAAIVIVGAAISYTFTRKPIRGPEAKPEAAAAIARQ
jgi:ACS family glucarate transporter-like MFS transporter